jgi:hypothetical protein
MWLYEGKFPSEDDSMAVLRILKVEAVCFDVFTPRMPLCVDTILHMGLVSNVSLSLCLKIV